MKKIFGVTLCLAALLTSISFAEEEKQEPKKAPKVAAAPPPKPPAKKAPENQNPPPQNNTPPVQQQADPRYPAVNLPQPTQPSSSGGRDPIKQFGGMPVPKIKYNTVHNCYPTKPVIIILPSYTQSSLIIQGNLGGFNFRSGYTHYDKSWKDDNFGYRYYIFNPSQKRCAISPFYGYANLPGYILSDRVVISSYRSGGGLWSSYNWNRPSKLNGSYSTETLDGAIACIENAFASKDRRSVNDLVARDGRVSIFENGRYGYGMAADDFYDLLLDAAQNTRTQSYRITQIQTNYTDTARVNAKHLYTDAWGRVESAEHSYELRLEGDRWYIRAFQID